MPRSGSGALLPPLILTHSPRKRIASQQGDWGCKAQHTSTRDQHRSPGSAALPGPAVGLQALGRGASPSQVCQTPASTHGSGHSQLQRNCHGSQQPGQPTPSNLHPNSCWDSGICSSNSLLDKSICRYRVTRHMYTHGTHRGHQKPLGHWVPP